MSRYEYAYDPYSFSSTPKGYSAQGHSYGFNLFVPRSRADIAMTRRVPAPNEQIYGYVEGEDRDRQVPRDDELTYYYDESGTLQFDPRLETRRELPQRSAWEEEVRIEAERRSPDQERPPGDRVREFQGEVTDISTATGRTDNILYLIARIRQPNDTYETVQVGPMGRTLVREGDWIQGMGLPGWVQGRPVLLARRVAVNGNWHTIRENSAREAYTFTGELVATRSVYLDDTRERQGIAELQVRPGVIYPVLLGPVRTLMDNGVRAGSQIEVWVRDGALDETPVLVAEQVKANDRLIRVYYEPDQFNFTTAR